MWESVALIIAAILAAYAVCMSFYNTYRSGILDDREKDLEEQSSALDERANRIAAEEQTIRGEWESLRKAHNEIIGKKADKTTTPTE